MNAPSIFLSAGETSGDLHGAVLARALKERWPGVRLFGLGGDRMAAEGVELLAHTDQLAVMGLVEVLRHLPFFVGLMERVQQTLEQRAPDLVIPIDYPGFNLRLAKRARKRGIPVLYYIAPQVWAWHRSRMRELAENTNHLAVVLPFEAELFREAGANAHFVGHPLLDTPSTPIARQQLCSRLGLDPERPIVALFPGSRAQEISRHLDLFAQAARCLRGADALAQPVFAAAPGIEDAAYSRTGFPFTRDADGLLAHARGALVKSGTTTLQTALAGVPMVITYRLHPLTYRIAKRLVSVPHIGLANLIAGERLMPELVQDEATPETLAAALMPLLRNGAQREAALGGLARVRQKLAGPPDGRTTSQRVTALAAELIETR